MNISLKYQMPLVPYSLMLRNAPGQKSLSKILILIFLVSSVVESTEITGHVSLKVSQETGLPEGIPVVGGGGDQSSEVLVLELLIKVLCHVYWELLEL